MAQRGVPSGDVEMLSVGAILNNGTRVVVTGTREELAANVEMLSVGAILNNGTRVVVTGTREELAAAKRQKLIRSLVRGDNFPCRVRPQISAAGLLNCGGIQSGSQFEQIMAGIMSFSTNAFG